MSEHIAEALSNREFVVGKWYIIKPEQIRYASFTGKFPFLILKRCEDEEVFEVLNYEGRKAIICLLEWQYIKL